MSAPAPASLHLFLPGRAALAGLALPAAVAATLGKADHAATAAGDAAQLARMFDVLPRSYGAAALMRAAETPATDVARTAWLRADPAHLQADINGGRLLATGAMLGLDAEDVAALVPALRPLFGDSGFELDAPHPERWYLRLPREARLPAFEPPAQALGDDALAHFPEGETARRWRALWSESQVLLHQHPHNARRREQGRLPVNSLWFWGGGLLPDHVSTTFPSLCSDDPLLHALARAANIPAMQRDVIDPATIEDAVDLRDLAGARRLLSGLLTEAVARIRGNALAAMTLDFADGVQLHAERGQRWRFWRKPLADLAA